MSATTSTIRILLADDHGIVRQGLRAVLARDPAQDGGERRRHRRRLFLRR